VHAERAEQADVAPLLHVGADAVALVDGDRHPEGSGVQRRLQPDGPGTEDRDARKFAPGHRVLLANFSHCIGAKDDSSQFRQSAVSAPSLSMASKRLGSDPGRHLVLPAEAGPRLSSKWASSP